MVVTLRDVLKDELFATADPRIEISGSGLDKPVRWVFTNEREDVASFLSGGELLVIEGSSLVLDGRAERLAEYAKSLVHADIAALVVELVEGVTELPERLVQAAGAERLTVIGLHRRIPFVSICQSVNTMIVRNQMHAQMQVDVMSTALREELASAGDAQAVADTVARVFGERVTIFDVDGLEVARSGRTIKSDASWDVILQLMDQSKPLGALEMSQGNTILDDAMKRCVERIISPILAVYLDGGARVGMIAHLIAGPEDGVHITSMEARDGHAMLEALGFAASSVYMPFDMQLKSLSDAIPAFFAMIDVFESREGYEVVSLLKGDEIIGFLATDDCGGKVADFSKQCLYALETAVSCGVIRAMHGRVALDTISLMDTFGTLRFARKMRSGTENDSIAYGRVECADSTLFERMLGVEHTSEAVCMMVTQTVGYELMHNTVLIDTLCACFDNLDNKTGACEQLGIQRQTLYNRLDKVTQMVGISPSDKSSWSMLLLGAKLAKTQRNHAISTRL